MTYKRQTNTLVDILVILFGVSSWVAINGLWVELPVLVTQLPESWKLASYVVITSQLANLGPVCFSIARKIWSQKRLEVPMIHASLFTVIISCAFMSIFWKETTYIRGELHSTAFLILTFFMAPVDCTSSLLYLPFIANFQEEYVVSYLIGAGLSGPIPSMLALAQGVGGYPECKNITTINETEYGNVTEHKIEPYFPPPRFSVDIFFASLSAQMVISWIAFLGLCYSPQAKRERVILIPITRPPNPVLEENFQSSCTKDLSNSLDKTTSSGDVLIKKPKLSKFKILILLIIQGFLCMLHNGILLSIQTYSCLPYGSLAFHLTVTLSSIANPICCLWAMFFFTSNVASIGLLTTATTCWSAYILTTAVLSPHPPLVNTTIGPYLIVFAWVLVSGSVAFIKACIASILRHEGGQLALYLCGVVTQIGSAIGAVLTFSFIQFTTIFKAYTPCK